MTLPEQHLSGLALIGGVALLAGAVSGSASAFHNSRDRNRSSTSYPSGGILNPTSSYNPSYSSIHTGSTSRRYGSYSGDDDDDDDDGDIWSSSPTPSTRNYNRNYNTSWTRTTGSGGSSQHGTRQSLPSTTTSYYTNAPTQTGNRPFTSTNEQSHVGEWQNGVCGDDTESNSDYYILPCYYDGENWIYPHEYAYHDEGLEWAPRKRVDNNSQKNTDNVPPTSNNPRSNARKTTDYDFPSSTIEKSTAQPKTETAPPISTNEMRNEQKKPENVSSTSSNRKRNRRKKRKNASSASSAIKANEQRKTDSVSSISIDSKRNSHQKSGNVRSTPASQMLIDKILDGYTELGEEDHGPMHKLIVDNLCNLTELLKSVGWAEKITRLIIALAEKRMMANRNMLTEKKSDATCRLFVGNLSPSATSDTLKAYFARYAEIVKACVECNEMTQRSKGYGFVECATFEDAQKILISGPHYIDRRRVTVRYSRPRGFE